MVKIIDCHSHFPLVTNGDDSFLAELQRCGIEKIFANTVSGNQWHELSTWAANKPQIIPFYGIHPWHISAATLSADLQELAVLLGRSHACCGEIGLDRLCHTDFALQKEVFRRQLELAAETGTFVAIHCVKSWGPLLEMLTPFRGRITFMVHSFQGSQEVMERVVGLGGMISFSHRLLHGASGKSRQVVTATPLHHLLLETDFPFQKKDQADSARTYCRVLLRLYTLVSQLRRLPLAELAQAIKQNGTLCTH